MIFEIIKRDDVIQTLADGYDVLCIKPFKGAGCLPEGRSCVSLLETTFYQIRKIVEEASDQVFFVKIAEKEED